MSRNTVVVFFSLLSQCAAVLDAAIPAVCMRLLRLSNMRWNFNSRLLVCVVYKNRKALPEFK
jgi:hypothetical protein